MTKYAMIKPQVQMLGATDRTGWSKETRGSRQERGYGAEWVRTVKRIRARDCDICQTCVRRGTGALGVYSAIDHKVNKARGGTDADSNLEVICRTCHSEKTQRESLGR